MDECRFKSGRGLHNTGAWSNGQGTELLRQRIAVRIRARLPRVIRPIASFKTAWSKVRQE